MAGAESYIFIVNAAGAQQGRILQAAFSIVRVSLGALLENCRASDITDSVCQVIMQILSSIPKCI